MAKIEVKDADVESTNHATKPQPVKIEMNAAEKSVEEFTLVDEEVEEKPKKESVKGVLKPDTEEVEVKMIEKTDENIKLVVEMEKSDTEEIEVKTIQKTVENIKLVEMEEPKKESAKDDKGTNQDVSQKDEEPKHDVPEATKEIQD